MKKLIIYLTILAISAYAGRCQTASAIEDAKHPDNFKISFASEKTDKQCLTLSDTCGNAIWTKYVPVKKGLNTATFYSKTLAPGIYKLSIAGNEIIFTKRYIPPSKQ